MNEKDNTNKKNQPDGVKPKPSIQQKAVAIKYDPGYIAPKVVASGQGYLADKILENAKNYNVPTYKDPKLVEELYRIDLGENIPPELYEVVAQILIFISDLDRLEEYKKHGDK